MKVFLLLLNASTDVAELGLFPPCASALLLPICCATPSTNCCFRQSSSEKKKINHAEKAELGQSTAARGFI